MSEHPINSLMDTTLEKIRTMVDVNTIVGEPINLPDGTTIIPVSKVSYGFASGGSDIPNKSSAVCFGGGSGAGITITPIAFLAVSSGETKMLHISADNNTANTAVNLVPELFDKVVALFKKDKKEAAE